jgi:hypothetical protein
MADTLREEPPVRGHEFVAEYPSGARVHLLAYSRSISDRSGRRWGAVNAIN